MIEAEIAHLDFQFAYCALGSSLCSLLGTILSMLIHEKSDKAIAMQGSLNSGVVVLHGGKINTVFQAVLQSPCWAACVGSWQLR